MRLCSLENWPNSGHSDKHSTNKTNMGKLEIFYCNFGCECSSVNKKMQSDVVFS